MDVVLYGRSSVSSRPRMYRLLTKWMTETETETDRAEAPVPSVCTPLVGDVLAPSLLPCPLRNFDQSENAKEKERKKPKRYNPLLASCHLYFDSSKSSLQVAYFLDDLDTVNGLLASEGYRGLQTGDGRVIGIVDISKHVVGSLFPSNIQLERSPTLCKL